MASKAQEYVKAMGAARTVASVWKEQCSPGEVGMRVYVHEGDGRCMFDMQGDDDEDGDEHFGMQPDQALALGRWLLETFTDATPPPSQQE